MVELAIVILGLSLILGMELESSFVEAQGLAYC